MLLVMAEDYIHTRQDMLMLLVNLSGNPGKMSSDYYRVDRWSRKKMFRSMTYRWSSA
jgi:hypothetical protein